MRVKPKPTPSPTPAAKPPSPPQNTATAAAPQAAPADRYQPASARNTHLPAPGAEPKLVNVGRKTPQYEPVSGSPFDADGVSADDVVQGSVGDCFLLSTLASLAQRRPDALRQMVVDHGDGTYTVTLYARHKGEKAAMPVPVTIDGRLPELPAKRSGPEEPVYAASPDHQELWVALVEKAAATLASSGYRTLNRGGSEADAMLTLTGQEGVTTDIDAKASSQLFAKLQAACASGKLTTAGTFDAKTLPAHLAELAKQGLTTLDPHSTYESLKLVDGHAYTVLGVENQNGEPTVVLRNPWGSAAPEPDGDGKHDGVFRMPLAEFAAVFEEVTISS